MKNKILYGFVLLMGVFALAGCSEDSIVENPSGETFIYRMFIANGGLAGTDAIQGVIDEETRTITFNAPAETDIQAIKFTSKLSLGAHLDQETYDFNQSNTLPVTVINGENRGTYQVTINFDEPKETPIITAVRVKLPDGTEKNAYVSEIDKSIYLGADSCGYVEILSISCLPKRTVTTLTMANNNMVEESNPGSIELDFMGIKSEYRLLFAAIPVFGADFNRGFIYPFCNATGNLFGDFVGENTRSADFDGNNLLIVSREGGPNVRVIPFNEIKGGNPGGVSLNLDGVEMGTFLVSAGRICHGHYYVSNLSTSVGEDQPLKLYYWDNTSSKPQVLLEFLGAANGPEGEVDLSKLRFGDNLNVCLDESGNGYIYFVTQDGTAVLRFNVTGFTNLENPTYLLPPTTLSYYASVNPVYGKDNEYIVTSIQAGIYLTDADLNVITTIDIEKIPVRCTDARVIVFDSERYLITTSGRWGSWSGDAEQTFYIYDLSEGATTALAIMNLVDGDEPPQPLFTYVIGGANPASFGSAPSASTGWGVVNGMLRVMSAAPKAGFAIFEFPERE
ncbi:MAG: DUF4623 domain-containing protein [Muribaculaceae bacterium]|nr:DUF4623 domain-containing protein [Muribaculaceae bacterium]